MTTAGSSESSLVIVHATYGPLGSGIDVTEKVKDLVSNGRLEIPGGLSKVFGEVAPWQKKVLILEYRLGSGAKEVLRKVYDDNDPVVISAARNTVTEGTRDCPYAQTATTSFARLLTRDHIWGDR